jgi:hypothetical protein
MCGRIFLPAAEFFDKSSRIFLPGVGNTESYILWRNNRSYCLNTLPQIASKENSKFITVCEKDVPIQRGFE